MFEITWHKLWCIMNESQKRKVTICGNNLLAREFYIQLNLLDICVDYAITDDEWLLCRCKRCSFEEINPEKHYIIFTDLENEKIYNDKMRTMNFKMFYHYRFLKDFDLAEYYKKPEKSATIIKGISEVQKPIKPEDFLKIFVLSHKKCDIPSNNCYQGLQLGSEGKQDLFGLQDKQGDNISKKNKQYCELTGIYWLWKNMNIDYIGVCHYRRYFCKDFGKIIDEPYTRYLLANYDILVPTPMKFKSKNKKYLPKELNILTQYQQEHYIKDLLFVEYYFKRFYSNYIEDFWEVMEKETCYGYNMFITSKKLFDSYSEWLFPILLELEKNREMIWEDNYQKRVYGFLSERLFNVWLHHQKIRIKELPVIQEEYKNLN